MEKSVETIAGANGRVTWNSHSFHIYSSTSHVRTSHISGIAHNRNGQEKIQMYEIEYYSTEPRSF